MSVSKSLRNHNYKMNDLNFTMNNKIRKIEKKLLYIESVKTIWTLKDRIKELKHKILINEQQVRFNLMVLVTLNNKVK